MDCRVETFRSAEELWRAEVIRIDTGQVVYVTWPYRREASARSRARRWIIDRAAERRHTVRDDELLFNQ